MNKSTLENRLYKHNGNWTEWSVFGLKPYNRTSAQGEFDLKSQAWFQTKMAQHEVQLPLYYSHFEIAELNHYEYFIDLV